MCVIKKNVEQLHSSLLVILLTLSLVVQAQTQSQVSTIDQKRAAQKPGDVPPPASLSSDDKPDAKLAVYQVHRIGDKLLALRSVRAKAFEIARLAAALWKQDETRARFLFEKALTFTIAEGNDPESISPMMIWDENWRAILTALCV